MLQQGSSSLTGSGGRLLSQLEQTWNKSRFAAAIRTADLGNKTREVVEKVRKKKKKKKLKKLSRKGQHGEWSLFLMCI